MSDVTIKYKGQPIATMDATGSKTLQTQGKYCEGDIGVEYVKPAAPTGTKQISITQNGTTTEDVAAYANAEITVNVPTGGSEWGSRWTEVTSAINVTNAGGIAEAIFNGVLGPGTADHVHLGILRGKSKDNFPQYQILLFERVGVSSGNGSRYNSGATTMNGASSIYDAAIEIGDTFMVTDLDYSV